MTVTVPDSGTANQCRRALQWRCIPPRSAATVLPDSAKPTGEDGPKPDSPNDSEKGEWTYTILIPMVDRSGIDGKMRVQFLGRSLGQSSWPETI
ncbi:MAG: hypothetical protein JXA11_01505 [Phycisphaerae bacterium]|nr:hypothetical protein [Phycisphaerae bacterium]